ncbi:MAG: hypothetical protein QXQ61_02420 [Candidatus Bathyarchaeia archaeon]
MGTLDIYDTLQYTYVNTPLAPSTPSGPNYGYRGVSYSYSASTIDPNCDMLKYEFYWGDGLTTLTSNYASGAIASASHSWSSSGVYNVKVRAQDSTGTWSEWSPILTVGIANRVPNMPSTPSGPTSGRAGNSYSYSTWTTDPDDNRVCYQFNWGDDSYLTTDYYYSGSTVYASHNWNYAGTYYVKVRANDGEAWSPWSSSLTVTIKTSGGGGGGGVYPTIFALNDKG